MEFAPVAHLIRAHVIRMFTGFEDLDHHCRNQPDEEKMNEQQNGAKTKKAAKSLDDEIAATREKLRKLEEQKKDKERRELEKNRKAITTLLSTEKLDAVPIEVWTTSLPGLRKMLKAPDSRETKPTAGARPGPVAKPSPRKESGPPAVPAAKPAEQVAGDQAGASAHVPEAV